MANNDEISGSVGRKQTLVETAASQTVRRLDCGLREVRTEQFDLAAMSAEVSATSLDAKHVSHSSSRRILRSVIVLYSKQFMQ